MIHVYHVYKRDRLVVDFKRVEIKFIVLTLLLNHLILPDLYQYDKILV